MKKKLILLIGVILVVTGSGRLISQSVKGKVPYIIVDTGQIRCYDNYTEIPYPKTNTGFFGQDAHYNGNQPAYRDNGDGTVTDLNTGLMWTRDPGSKKTYEQAAAGASRCRVGGCRDWRLPTIKELYSLILFSGTGPHPGSINSNGQKPFIGRAMGYMRGHWMDVHGAGAQRSDPKSGDQANYLYGRGPQGDAIRIYNYVRCVREGIAQPRTTGPKVEIMQKSHGFRISRKQAPGQDRRREQFPSGDNFIRRLDRDGDGKVSREEFAGPKEHFNHFDKNGDGFISREESPKGLPAARHSLSRRRR
jgi:hypothetical protein